MKRIVTIVMAFAMAFLIGCGGPVAKEPEAPPIPEAEEEAATMPELEEGLMEEFEALASSGAHAGELGLFIRGHMDETDPGDAERMVEILVLRQQRLIEHMNRVIYEPPYMEALNVAMEGVLSPERVPLIQDEVVRSDFQNMADGFLTIVRYEETPVAETDWEALSALNPYFSEDFATMTTLYDKIQNYKYNRREPDFDAIYADAVLSESLILSNEKSFLTWQLDKLYQRQVSSLLVGPEGSHIDVFVAKDSGIYRTLMAAADAHPHARVSALVKEMDKADATDFKQVMDKVEVFDVFGLKSPIELVFNRSEAEESLVGIKYVAWEGEPEKMQAINDLINAQALGLVPNPEETAEVAFNNYISFGNDAFFSMYLSGSYMDADGSFNYEETYLTIDLATGKAIGLDDFLGRPFEVFKEDLEEITGQAYETMPQFAIDRDGIALNAQQGDSPYSRYAFISFDELAAYVPMERFYK